MFKSAYFRRLFLPYLLLICGAMLIVGLLAARRLKTTYLDRTAHGMRDNAALVARLIRLEDRTKLNNQIAQLGRELHCRITVIAPDGVVIADNEADPARMENHRWRPEVIDALSSGEGVRVRRSDTIREDTLYFARLVGSGESAYLLRLSVHLRDLNQQLDTLYRNLALTGLVTTLVAGLLCYFFTRRHTIPVVELTEFADAIAHGDLSKRIVRAQGEIGTLGAALNSMADALGHLIDETNRDKAELLAMLSSMSEGVLAIDADQKIVVFNDAATRLFELDAKHVQGRFLWEVVNHPSLLQAAEQAMQSGEQRTFQIGPIARRHLQVTACPIKHAEARSGLVIVAFDATEAVRYEELRREFVANVSHELRTPLTAIKGFAETLRDVGPDDPEQSQRHLAIIEKNADQLTNLVNDLLELSKLEGQPSTSSRRVRLDLSDLVKRAVDLLAPIAQRKDQQMDVQLVPDLPPITGVPDYLERSVANLIDNAIKYTPAGGRISVKTSAQDHWAIVEVSDTGIGIPPSDVSRIFERFYRVDRSRSREMGGTGLGLSIVKHVVQSHQGKVEVTSELGRGSTFTIKLPMQTTTSLVTPV